MFFVFDIQESVSVPVVYIEAVVMMLGTFLIGYISAQYFVKAAFSKKLKKLQSKINTQLQTITTLKKEVKENLGVSYRKDRMDQDFEQQVQFQKRAYSEQILYETTGANGVPVLNFDTIGHATVQDRDDLQLIVGIGPYTEAKLNNFGIFTFEQISRFTEMEITKVTELIKFFPDRIKNDKWVSKAKELLAKKQQDLEESNNLDSKKKTPKKVIV